MRQLILDGHTFWIKQVYLKYKEYVLCAYKDKMCNSMCAFCAIEDNNVYCQNHLIGKIIPKE